MYKRAEDYPMNELHEPAYPRPHTPLLGRLADLAIKATPGFMIEKIHLRADSDERSSLSEPYVDVVTHMHALASRLVAAKVERGQLHDDDAVPNLASFTNSILDLRPAFEKMEEVGLRPSVVFVPRHFEGYDWDVLLSGQDVPYSVIQKGRFNIINRSYRVPSKGGRSPETFLTAVPYTSWSNNHSQITDPIKPEAAPAEGWDMALVSGSNRTIVDKLSPDGYIGRRYFSELSEQLGWHGGRDDPSAVAGMSPTYNTYNALQWLRLAQGIKPADLASATIQRENFTDDMSLWGSWNVVDACVTSRLTNVRKASEGVGLRPTVSGSEVGELFPDIAK